MRLLGSLDRRARVTLKLQYLAGRSPRSRWPAAVIHFMAGRIMAMNQLTLGPAAR